jgi:hypothetical protein
MTKLEAVLKKTFSQALAGDKKAALTIIGLAQKEGFLTREEEEVSVPIHSDQLFRLIPISHSD